MGGRRALAGAGGACSGAGGQGYPRTIASHSFGAVRIPVGGGSADGAVRDQQGRRLSEHGRSEGLCAEGSQGTGGDAWRDGRGSPGRNDRGTLVPSAGSHRQAASSDAGRDAQPLPSRTNRDPAARTGRSTASNGRQSV